MKTFVMSPCKLNIFIRWGFGFFLLVFVKEEKKQFKERKNKMKTIKQRQKEVKRKIERIALFQGRRVAEIEQIIEENLDPVLPDKLYVDPVISFDSFEPEENFYDLEEVEGFIEASYRITEISEEKEDEETRFHRGELADMESVETILHNCYYHKD